ncbi:MAG: DUF5717 family protein [Defluviitaleaceae bacterium]|nr:DUF5717 family protein [Defluviitaleaceae bacterium]
MEKYEMPQAMLSVNVEAVSIETKGSHSGVFKIKNTGGDILKGRILSRCAGLVFEPAEWVGNSAEISYTFSAAVAGLGIGETIESKFYITSNGGEVEIPFSAKLTKVSITTADGYTIANIVDFYEYSLTHPTQARRIFTDSEFFVLLMSLGYKYMEVYESLHKDANRERAMDNFFILSGLKGRTTISIDKANDKNDKNPQIIEFTQKPNSTDMLHGHFQVRKSDKGYAEAPLHTNAPWLTLSSGKLTAADFDEEFISTVNFSIDPTKIGGGFARERIIIGVEEDGNIIEIVYRRLPPFSLRLNRDTYRYADRGTIEVVNNTGGNMHINVFCPENYIKFYTQSISVGARGELGFEVKLSAFMSAQMLFRKLPFMKTTIEVKATRGTQTYKKTLPITVGEW